MVRLEIKAAGSARAQVELELSRVQSALSISEGGQLKAESELAPSNRPWWLLRRPAGG